MHANRHQEIDDISASALRPWDLGWLSHELKAARADWRDAHRSAVGADGFPTSLRLAPVLQDLCAALFPQRLGEAHADEEEELYVARLLDRALGGLHREVELELRHWANESETPLPVDPDRVLRHFALSLPAVRRLIDSDIEAAFAADPAALSIDEVLICYPGAIAIIYHRLAHLLHGLGTPLVARIIAEIAHSRTGIDIHPGATIGPRFFIDHGTGVVIGETAIVGAGVRLYQAVTLGARRLPTEGEQVANYRVARHPIVEDGVVIFAGATILGRVTIGAGSVIGGNVWLVSDVPAGSVVTQAAAESRIARRS